MNSVGEKKTCETSLDGAKSARERERKRERERERPDWDVQQSLAVLYFSL